MSIGEEDAFRENAERNEPMKRTPPPRKAGRDGLVWLIRELLDIGPRRKCRYLVRGEVWYRGRFVTEFSWRASDMTDPAYYVPRGRQFDAARTALAKARGEEEE